MRTIKWSVLFASLILWSDVLEAQLPCVSGAALETRPTSEVRSIAARLAPVLHFAPGERYFPTLPQFSAFSKAPENETDGQELQRWAPLTGDAKRRLDSEWTDQQYLKTMDANGLPTRAAVMYSHRWLDPDHVEELWTGLARDGQAVRRASLFDRESVVEVFEYYFYYVNDFGLQGHPNDVEMVFVYVPHIKCERLGQGTPTQSLIVVGAGHSYYTPNNVLVLSGRSATSILSGSSALSVLVELGGHASAPDVSPYGQFDVGRDINWFLGENLWGTRDLMAVSGVGYLGKYESWMTLPRPSTDAVVLHPVDYLATLEPQRRLADSSIDLRSRRFAEGLAAGAPSNAKSQYLLVSMSDLEDLESIADSVKDTRDIAKIRKSREQAVSLVNDRLHPQLETWGFAPWYLDEGDKIDARLARIRQWRLDWTDVRKLAAKGSRPWTHETHRQPAQRLVKSYLYRPAPIWSGVAGQHAIRDALRLNVSYTSSASLKALVGYSFAVDPVFQIPGVFEAQVGVAECAFARSLACSLAIALQYERDYRRLLTWYSRADFLSHRRIGQSDSTLGRLGLGGGLAITPFSFSGDGHIDRFFRKMTIRVGAHTDFFGGRFRIDRARPDVGLSWNVRQGS